MPINFYALFFVLRIHDSFIDFYDKFKILNY